jgi:hypothetical protein
MTNVARSCTKMHFFSEKIDQRLMKKAPAVYLPALILGAHAVSLRK